MEKDSYGTPEKYHESLSLQDKELRDLGNLFYAGFMACKDGNEGLAKRMCEEFLTLINNLSLIGHDIQTGERNLAPLIEEWIREIKRDFFVTECDDELHIVTYRDKTNRRQVLNRLKNADIITPIPGKPRWWRYIENEADVIKWWEAKGTTVDLILPLLLHEKCNLFPGNIVVIAGQKDAGKTTVCLNTAYENRDKFRVIYQSSEMGEEELAGRIHAFEYDTDEWKKVRFINKSSNFADFIQPNCLNIVDYLELKQGETYEVGNKLLEIYEKLDGQGLAVVALQVSQGKEIARGGDSSLDKPRLYVSLKYTRGDKEGQAKIISAKNFRGHENPNGQVLIYKIVGGHHIYGCGVWHEEGTIPEDDKWKKNTLIGGQHG